MSRRMNLSPSTTASATTSMVVGGRRIQFEFDFDTSATVVVRPPTLGQAESDIRLNDVRKNVSGSLANGRISGSFEYGSTPAITSEPRISAYNASIFLTQPAQSSLATSVLGLYTTNPKCPLFNSTSAGEIGAGQKSVMELFDEFPGVGATNMFSVYLPPPRHTNRTGFLDLSSSNNNCANVAREDFHTTIPKVDYCGWSMQLDTIHLNNSAVYDPTVHSNAFINFSLSSDGITTQTSLATKLISTLMAGWSPEETKRGLEGLPFPCIHTSHMPTATFVVRSDAYGASAIAPTPLPNTTIANAAVLAPPTVHALKLTPDMYIQPITSGGGEPNMCRFVIYGDNRAEPSWTFGAPFFQTHAVFFDRRNLRVSYDRRKMFVTRLRQEEQDRQREQAAAAAAAAAIAASYYTPYPPMSPQRPSLHTHEDRIRAQQLAWQAQHDQAMEHIRASAGITPVSQALPTPPPPPVVAQPTPPPPVAQPIPPPAAAARPTSPLPEGKASLEMEMDLVRQSSGVGLASARHGSTRHSQQPEVFTHAMSATAALNTRTPLEKEMDRIREASGAYKQPEECRHNSDLLQPTAHTSEPIAAATIAGSSSSSASGTATPSSSSTSAHSLRKQASGNSLRPSSVLSLSLQGNGGNSTLKRCPLSPELMPAASAEAVMADLKSNQDVADDRKSSHSTTTRNGSATSSASKALEKIIQLSGPTTTAALTAPTSSSTPPPPKDNEPQPSSAENTPTTDHTSDQLATPAAAAPTPPLPVPHAAAAAATTLLGTEDHHTFSASSPPSTPRSSTPAPTDKSHSPEPAAASRSRTAVQLYKQENASQRSSLSILADWWSGNNASSTTTTTTTTTTTAAIAVSEPTTQNNHPSQPSVTQEQPTLPSLDHSQDTPLQTGQQQQQKKDPKDTLPRDDVSTTDGHTSSASKPTAAVHNDLSETTRRSMENWEPSGPEKTALERFKASEGRDPACSSSTSLPSSLPSHLTSPFPVSMIKSSGAKTKAESAKEQRSSTGSSSSSSSWWGLWNANGGVGDHGNQGVVTDMGADDDNSPSRQVSTITTSHLSSLATEVATASELHMELLEGEEAVRSSQSSLQMSSETLGRTEGGLTMAATSASERSKQTSKRWTIFGLGGGSSSSSNGSVSGDEAKGNGSTSKEETTAPDSSAVLTSDHATTGTTILKTSVAVPNVDAGAVATTTTKGGEEDSQKGGVAVPTAPALVGTAEVDVTVQTGGGDVTTKDSNNNKTKKQKESPTLAPANSSYSGWLSVIPGFGNRSAEDAQAQQRRAALQEAALSHQITDYEEGERHDIHGNLIKFEPQTDEDEDTSVSGSNNDKKKATAKTKTFAQLAEEKHDAKAGKTEDSSRQRPSNAGTAQGNKRDDATGQGRGGAIKDDKAQERGVASVL
ncbi:hypothetical protein BGZ73_004034 [Actinomortierella ambigua]|nr:hypothetical protein BGZ73_004034 [Actinomortierella ambigua]